MRSTSQVATVEDMSESGYFITKRIAPDGRIHREDVVKVPTVRGSVGIVVKGWYWRGFAWRITNHSDLPVRVGIQRKRGAKNETAAVVEPGETKTVR